MSSNLKSFNVGYGIEINEGSECVELYREYEDGKEECLSGLDELYLKEDADQEIDELRKKHTWKNCSDEPPPGDGIYLVECLTRGAGLDMLIAPCLFSDGKWMSLGDRSKDIISWCEMPVHEVHR